MKTQTVLLYVNAEVSTRFTSIDSGLSDHVKGHVIAVVYFTDGARMDLNEHLTVQSIVGNAVNDNGSHIVSQNPGTSVLTVAWNCAGDVVGTGEVDVHVDIPQPVGLVIELANDRLADDITGLMIVGIPDRTEVTVFLNFGDNVRENVTSGAAFDGPRFDNIWMPFDSTTQYNDTATLSVSYDYYGQMITGEISATIVRIERNESLSLRVTTYGKS